MSEFLKATEAMIATWHGLEAPNDAGRRMAADLATIIAAFERQRGMLRFEEEPSSFDAALLETREGA